jgi:hypothetical protein
VLIALPFTAPFAMFDLRDSMARGRFIAAVDAVSALAPDDGPAWSDRSGYLHHAMPPAALNSGHASLDVPIPAASLQPPAVTSVPFHALVITAVLRL